MLIFEVNDTKVNCPSCWEEAKLKHFQSIMRDCVEGDNPVKVFSKLTGTNYEAVDESQSEDLEAGIYQATAFVFNQTQTFRDAAIPEFITLRGKKITLPRKIQRLTVGQNFQVRVALSTAKNLESVISIVSAIYLQPLVDESKFDYSKAKELEAEILELDLFEVFPIGFFLLKRLINSSNSGTIYSLLNRLKKLRRMLFSRWLPVSISLSLCMTSVLLIDTQNTMANSHGSFSKSRLMSSCLSSCSGNDRANFRTDLTFSTNP